MSTEIITLSNYRRDYSDVVKDTQKGYATYGERNLGFEKLIRLSKESPTNSAVLNGLNRLVYGKGLAAKNSGGSNAAMFAKAISMISPFDQKKAVVDYNIMQNVALLVTKSPDGSTAKIEHIPTQMVAAGLADEKGNTNSYFYSTELGSKDSKRIEATEYPNFDLFPDSPVSIKYIKVYSPNSWYFDEPDYQGSIEYMEVEIENGKYHVNNVKTRFSAQTAITLFNGDPGKEKRGDVKRKIKSEYSGSEGNTLAINFVDKDATPPKYDHFPIRDLHKQQEYIGIEATEKILLGHGVAMASIIFGVKGSTGLGNNADELEKAFITMSNMTILPKQNVIIEGFKSIFKHYDITLDFYFEPIKPNEVINEANQSDSYDGSQIESALSIVEKVNTGILTKEQGLTFMIQMLQFDEDIANGMFPATQLAKEKTELEKFIELGSDGFEGYDLIDESPVDYDTIDTDEYSPVHLTKLDKIYNLATTGTARPNAKSEQDSEDIIIRYRYKGHKTGERDFCNKMLKSNKLYRKEDIIQMENKPVNPGFGLDGTDTYSIWLWKGGGLQSETFPNGTCKHFWQREIYLKKGVKIDANSPLAKTISTSEARRRGYEVPTNDSKVSIAPHNMK